MIKKNGILVLVFLLSWDIALSQAVTALDKADIEFKGNNFYKASSLYKRALRRSPLEEIKRIYFQLGECYREVNNYGQARQWYVKAIEEGFSDSIVYFHMGNLLAVGGDYRGAKEYFETFLVSQPEHRLALARIASCNFAITLEADRPFYEIKNLKELNTEFSDYSITFINDYKAVISTMRMDGPQGRRIDPRTMQGFSNLFETNYDAQRDRWSIPSIIKGEINTSFNEGTFAYNKATKTAYYMQCRGRGAMDNCGILSTRYNESTNQWSPPKALEMPYGTSSIGHPTISTDGKTMIFVSDMPGGFGGTDLWMSKHDGFSWGRPENLGPNVNTPGNEMFPYLFDDKILYFSSDGHVGLGGLDIFSSELIDGQYSRAVNLKPPFNSSADDFGFSFRDYFKNDGFFISNRPGGVGDDDIYYFNLIPVVITLSGSAIDSESLKPLRDVKIYLQGNDGFIDSTLTDRNGTFKLNSLKAITTYRVYAQKDGYLGDSKQKSVGVEKYSIDLSLEPFSLMKITKEEIVLQNIYYDYAKWSLREESKEELNKLVKMLNENPGIRIMINSHTDVRGSASYNKDLSEKRAQSVVEHLSIKGIDPSRLESKGWGAERLLIINSTTEEQHQLNRRTTFNILNVEEISSKFIIKTLETLEMTEEEKIFDKDDRGYVPELNEEQIKGIEENEG